MAEQKDTKKAGGVVHWIATKAFYPLVIALAFTLSYALAESMGVTEICAIATAALREAEDGPAFRDEITAATGIDIRVVTGREEARLAAEGVLLGWPSFEGVIADLGGASLELARAADIPIVISSSGGGPPTRTRSAGWSRRASS